MFGGAESTVGFGHPNVTRRPVWHSRPRRGGRALATFIHMPRASVTTDSTTPCVVVDNGSGVIKAGFAGEEEPRVLLPSYGLDGLPADTRPIEKGIIRDWDAMEAYWDHAFGQLRIDTEQCNLMLTAPLFDTKDNKERLMQCLFETFAASGVYVSAPAVFELYAAGKENGVVLGCGAECTYALLMHEGLPDPRTLVRSDVAGEALTRHTQSVLQQLAGGGEVPWAAACKAKETLGLVAPDGSGTLPKEAAARSFELPDGRKLNITPQARASMAEPLFDSSLVGHHTTSLAGLCYESIRLRCARAHRPRQRMSQLRGPLPLATSAPQTGFSLPLPPYPYPTAGPHAGTRMVCSRARSTARTEPPTGISTSFSRAAPPCFPVCSSGSPSSSGAPRRPAAAQRSSRRQSVRMRPGWAARFWDR